YRADSPRYGYGIYSPYNGVGTTQYSTGCYGYGYGYSSVSPTCPGVAPLGSGPSFIPLAAPFQVPPTVSGPATYTYPGSPYSSGYSGSVGSPFTLGYPSVGSAPSSSSYPGAGSAPYASG